VGKKEMDSISRHDEEDLFSENAPSQARFIRSRPLSSNQNLFSISSLSSIPNLPFQDTYNPEEHVNTDKNLTSHHGNEPQRPTSEMSSFEMFQKSQGGANQLFRFDSTGSSSSFVRTFYRDPQNQPQDSAEDVLEETRNQQSDTHERTNEKEEEEDPPQLAAAHPLQIHNNSTLPPNQNSVVLSTPTPNQTPLILTNAINSGCGHQYVDITEYLNMPQYVAARKLGIPASTLSKRWKEAVRTRKWPYRSVQKLDKEITTLLHNVPQGPDAPPLPKDIEQTLGMLLRKRQEELNPVIVRI